MTTCPVCGSPGADAQWIGTNVTVFCCPACLDMVLSTFARYAPPGSRWLPAVEVPRPIAV
jgi:hypothetical protein